MKSYITLLLVLFISFITACKTKEENLSRLWLYTHYSGVSDNTEFSFSPTSFLLLQKNGSYTKDFGVFEHGQWTLNEDVLILVDHLRESTTYPVKISSDEMTLKEKGNHLINFEPKPIRPEEETENPFSIKNNLWRIKAIHGETDSELVVRLINHCRYWETYFYWALNNDLSSLDVRSGPTPIKIYGNGFGLKTEEELPESWVNLFYDKRDCMQADKLLKKALKRNTIAWAQSEHKYKMYVGAFQQLQGFLKKSL